MENKSNAILACKYCGMRHSTIEELKLHMASHEGRDEKVIEDKMKIEKEVFGIAETPKTSSKIQWGSITVTFALVVLVSISILQAYESYNVMNKIQSGNFANASSSGLPSSVENLPNMVGGC